MEINSLPKLLKGRGHNVNYPQVGCKQRLRQLQTSSRFQPLLYLDVETSEIILGFNNEGSLNEPVNETSTLVLEAVSDPTPLLK